MSNIYFSSTDEINSTSVSVFEDLTFRDIIGTNIIQAGCIEGIAEAPIKNLTFDNVHLRKYEYPYFAAFVDGFNVTESNPKLLEPNAEKCFI